MTRLTTTSTTIGLLGMGLAVIAALSHSVPMAFVAVGFSLAALGFLGSVLGAASALGRVWVSRT